MDTEQPFCDVAQTRRSRSEQSLTKVPLLRMFMLSGLLFLSSSCTTTLQGVLLEENQSPLSQQLGKINVIKLADSQGEAQSFTSDLGQDGRFTLQEELSPGTYLVEALVPGYAMQSMRIQFPDEADKVRLVLKKLQDPNAVMIRSSRSQSVKAPGAVQLNPPQL